ncbi:MAG TPA: histidinol phosphate phosphatase [Erysipelotrichaceae bacterium]|jgi:histidinol-phosphatase (PHP family)|nr:histidinol-phosphatase [Erysipelotrichaceae bacterium]HCY05809.1 histidinol phosphate phosphatase [Erysipelotrichaceae bacterium]
MKKLYNYHTHTKRCGHAIGEDEEYVINAIKAGFKVLGFSDHAPYKKPKPTERMGYEQYQEYIDSIKYLQNKYKDQIEILIGLEVEYYPSQMEDLLRYRKEMDFCILGQHQQEIDGKDNYSLNKPSQLIEYATSLEKACDMGLVDIVAHPDLFMFNYPRWDKHCEEATNIIVDACIRNDIPFEINCGGIKYGKFRYEDGSRFTYPHRKAFEIVSKKNCPVVIGHDVHDPKHFIEDYWLDSTLSVVEGLNLNILDSYDIVSAANKRKEKLFGK